MLPQVILTQEYSPASDVWSFGIVMYEIWTGAQMPYRNLNHSQVKHNL